ncbi:UNVERIFIED_CONTAM: hypothetical protein RMT77_015244 [Armadillidium vulgare]
MEKDVTDSPAETEISESEKSEETLSSEEDSSSCSSIHSTVETPVAVYDEKVVPPTSVSSNVQAPKKNARVNPLEKTEIFMGLGRELLSYVKQDDPQDIYGKHIANKLRALQGYQRTLAEKLINDVLFEAEMGTLTRDFRIVNCR